MVRAETGASDGRAGKRGLRMGGRGPQIGGPGNDRFSVVFRRSSALETGRVRCGLDKEKQSFSELQRAGDLDPDLESGHTA